ncbi:DUF397 domain-containing protein [Streptomyces sp. 7N604]|uniref:DUF397 domain-containing protein n=1 Tax=Streptomyces sp. 7N604 TaxID=3457415 RepID=UPI003FD214BB
MSTPNALSHDIDLSHACWRKSSYSGGANDCVEIADLGPYVVVRDSKNKHMPPLVFDRSVMAEFLAAVAASSDCCTALRCRRPR